MDPLLNKTILITGASSGIGKQIALTLLKHNVNLNLVARNESSLRQLKNKKNKVANVNYQRVDFVDEYELSSFIDQLKKNDFKPDILIHCAGVYHHGVIKNTSNEMIDYIYKVNFRAPFIITRELLDIVIERKGQIIFINSTASLNPRRDVAAYASIKGALKTLAEVLHDDLHKIGVRVTSIYPGRVNTPMQKYVCKMEGSDFTPEKFLTVQEIAETVLHILTLPQNVELNQIIIRPT